MMTKTIPETLQEVAATRSYKEREAIMRTNDSKPLRVILRALFDPRIKFDAEVPADLSADDCPPDQSYSSLFKEHKKFYIFVEGSGVRPRRKKEILYQICLGLAQDEAKLFVDCLSKDASDWKGVTENIVMKAFPGLLGEDVVGEEEDNG